MRFAIARLNMILRNSRVDLGCSQIRVTEHGLNGAEVSPPLEQVRCKGMSQLVRRNFGSDPRRARIAAKELPESLPRQRFASWR